MSIFSRPKQTVTERRSIPVEHNIVRNQYRAPSSPLTGTSSTGTSSSTFSPIPSQQGNTKKQTSDYQKTSSQLSPKAFYEQVKEKNNYMSEQNIDNKLQAQFIGTCFASYVIFEQDANLLFLDFHASHERKLFDQLKAKPKPHSLLLPIPLALHMQESDIQESIERYKTMGIIIESTEKDKHMLCAIPQILLQDSEKIAKIIEENTEADNMDVKLFARKACRKAIKAGDHIDAHTAYSLLDYAMSLSPPRCPHGRPLWITIEKSKLDSLIQRI